MTHTSGNDDGTDPIGLILGPPDLGDTATQSWRASALCAHLDPDRFFPDFSGAGSAIAAKQVCRRCPVEAECLVYALTHDERFGVWGATTPTERRRIRATRHGCKTGMAS